MSDVMIEETGPRGMVTLRGDLKSEALANAVFDVTGLKIPQTGRILSHKDCAVAWMSPDEVLLLVPHEQTDAVVAALDKSLAKDHHLATNVSDARASFCIKGKGAREVIAKGAPADLAPDSFKPGEIRRTRLGQVAIAFWMTAPDSFELICFRSVSAFVADWLQTAARPGSLPDYFAVELDI